jgi:hypothetical protein
MPHAGLISENMKFEDAQLMRARLHYRGGKNRLERGDTDHGVAALYDAFISAMLRYVLIPELDTSMGEPSTEHYAEDRDLFILLRNSDIIDDSFTDSDFKYLLRVTEDAMNFSSNQTDIPEFMIRIENVLNQLDVLPIDENVLPSLESQII